MNAFRALTQGQEWAGWDAFKQLYSDVRVMPDTQLDPRSRYTLELVVLSPVCFRAARHAASTTLGLCAALAPTQPDQAQNYTMLYYIAMGDPVAAEHAREQCEVLTLRAGATNDTRLTRLQTTAWLYPLADDLMGLKRVAEELERVSEQRPGWRFTRDLVKAHALRTQGQAAKALMLIESLLKELPTAHYDFAPSAEAHVMILTQLARFEAAWSAGESYRERARACDIPTAWLDLALADCLARLARHEQAESLWQGALTALAQRDIGGMHLGYAYEVGARIARSRDDWEAFSDRADRCAEYYLPGRSPALIAKHRRLLDQTREADEQVVEPSAPTDDAVQTALSQCTDRIQRGQQACALICEYTKAAEAVLFGVRAGQLEAFTDSASVPQGMLFAVQSYLSVERDRDAEITCTAAAGEFADAARTEAVQTIEEPGHYTLGEHRYAPLLLRASDERGDYVVGVAMLRMSSTPIQVAAQRFVPNLSKALLANGDVDSLRLS